jgi:hypothetical protein
MRIELPLPNEFLCSIVGLNKPLADSNKITRQQTSGKKKKTVQINGNYCKHFKTRNSNNFTDVTAATEIKSGKCLL